MLGVDMRPLATDVNSVASGTRRRIPKFLLAAIAGVVLIGAGLGAGRIMWGSNGTAPALTANAPTSTAVPVTPPSNALTPDQAKQQACAGYAAISGEWSAGYKDWVAATKAAGENWTWSNPGVKAATDKFFPAQTDMAIRMRALITPETPPSVASAINDFTGAVLDFAAVRGTGANGTEINRRINAVDTTGFTADKVCGT